MHLLQLRTVLRQGSELLLLLSLTYVAGEMTFFKGVKKLLPGRYLIWKDGKLAITRYWKPEFHPDETKTLGDWADEIHNTLTEIMPEVKEESEWIHLVHLFPISDHPSFPIFQVSLC